MALGQQQQEELSICCRDVKHKFFVLLLKGEQPSSSVCQSIHAGPTGRDSGICRVPVGTAPWGCTDLGLAPLWEPPSSRAEPQPGSLSSWSPPASPGPPCDGEVQFVSAEDVPRTES